MLLSALQGTGHPLTHTTKKDLAPKLSRAKVEKPSARLIRSLLCKHTSAFLHQMLSPSFSPSLAFSESFLDFHFSKSKNTQEISRPFHKTF